MIHSNTNSAVSPADYRTAFVAFALACGALRFGEFQLKSGRLSPYFFNAGEFNSGRRVAELGHYYARAVHEQVDGEFMLFGPAYKGIPLVTATATALAQDFQRDTPFAFNRKEAKDHGEGGSVIGAPLTGRVVIIDDVITAGLSIGDSVQIIRAAGATPAAVVIALDRRERGLDGGHSAAREVAERYAMPVHAIADIDTVIRHLEGGGDAAGHLPAIRQYRTRYAS